MSTAMHTFFMMHFPSSGSATLILLCIRLLTYTLYDTAYLDVNVLTAVLHFEVSRLMDKISSWLVNMPGTIEKQILSTLFSYTEMWLVKYSYLK